MLRLTLAFATGLALVAAAGAAELGQVKRYHVLELTLAGPKLGPKDTPARDAALVVTFRHESGGPEVRAAGFWDGDGKGADTGGTFKVRFCPTQPGRWRLVRTESNRAELKGQREGDLLECVASEHPGFWVPDGRWYRRSDGSHPFIVGNTHYTFLSGHDDQGPHGNDPAADVRANARYFKKLRFGLGGGRYPDPKCKPFFDDAGRGTEDGRFSLRPNPRWFRRVDAAVRAGFETDLICDLIAAGPDTPEIRSTLQGDPAVWLGYLAARYGAYPNVWFCLCNEWNIKKPSYTPEQIVRAGRLLRAALPNPTPISVHGNTGNWDPRLNEGGWHDHAIIQWKLKTIPRAADAAAANHARGGNRPVCNDENAYEGLGDRFSEADVIEGCFGTFLGGGCPTTGQKPAGKKGQYFWGGFDASKHASADNLLALREYIDEHVAFWRMKPAPPESVFTGLPDAARLLADPGREYALGTNAAAKGIRARLPEGTWRVVQLDLFTKTSRTLTEKASGEFTFDTPDSRAVLTHFARPGRVVSYRPGRYPVALDKEHFDD
ncbi:MAG TPA: DUF5060 domain-containing protein [Phycisphaerae bacterium]|nr:DUF5060 domain-containing protein [Phycisphaerae bacterium]